MVRLQRFIRMQNYRYNSILKEIKSGYKSTDWMWYIFPQIVGLGNSEKSYMYAIRSLEEAKAYLDDKKLGNRLIECCNELLKLDIDNPEIIFGKLDSIKLKSCMTLFNYICPENEIFKCVLKKYYNNEVDEKTLKIIPILELKKGDVIVCECDEIEILSITYKKECYCYVIKTNGIDEDWDKERESNYDSYQEYYGSVEKWNFDTLLKNYYYNSPIEYSYEELINDDKFYDIIDEYLDNMIKNNKNK